MIASYHVNVSNLGNADVQVDVGKGGGLHVDYLDDYRRWTVLLSLGNLNEGDWPGRTMITSLRVYCVLAPLTALVFKAVQPHNSKGPVPMAGSTRKRYVPSITNLPILDTGRHAYSRITCPCYPKKAIMDRSPFAIRTRTPDVMNSIRGAENSRHPDLLFVAVHAFGTFSNMYNWHARAFAMTRATPAHGNSTTAVPSARVIADCF